MNDSLRPCRKERGERVRLARRGWRPAKHIFARYPRRRATPCTSIVQRQMVENRGPVPRQTPRSTTGMVALPNHSDPAPSQIKPPQLTRPFGVQAVLPRHSRRGEGGSRCPPNGEKANPLLSQCVAVNRSDKIVKGAGRPRPFFLSPLALASADAFLRLCVSSPFFAVKKSGPVKPGQSGSNQFLPVKPVVRIHAKPSQ